MIRWVLGVAVVGALVATASAGAAALIDGEDVKNSSLTGKDVKDKSLTKRDFRGSVRGPRGFQGAQGLPGPSGIASVSTVDGPAGAYCAGGGGSCSVASSLATCPAGSRVVGGGFDSSAIFSFVEFAKAGATTYGVIVVNDGPSSGTITAQAICASGPGIASARATAASERDAIRARVRELRTQAE